MTIKLTVENAIQAKQEVESLEGKGYTRENIYIFAHFKERSNDINDALDTEKVGMRDQGFLESMKNIFASRGDELRNKMEAAGLTKEEAAAAESELDKGKLVIVANQ
ncbi:general stress protein [Psychrobacillus sp.]|uniref:general stress protein n=1 Tax=Psychrobacillus sp. TaxID=1871623 RepID=UPI0028BE6E37|nr:general stress protein [Psychrobacillus sp.]